MSNASSVALSRMSPTSIRTRCCRPHLPDILPCRFGNLRLQLQANGGERGILRGRMADVDGRAAADFEKAYNSRRGEGPVDGLCLEGLQHARRSRGQQALVILELPELTLP